MGGSDSGIFGSGGYGRSRNFLVDQGPPYIVKLLHLPVSCDDVFVKDLFTSRFMPYIKFKIVYDPISNPLETGIVKKSAFVELKSFSDQNRVVNWQDLYYKGNRRVIIEHADFNDFQGCIKFNQDNDGELRRIERDFLANKTRGGFEGGRRSSHSGHIPGLGVLGELEELQRAGRDNLRYGGPDRRSSFGSSGHNGAPHPRPQTRFTSMHTATPKVIDPAHDTPVLGVQKPKPNPFGNAKPVDVLAKQHEMDKKIVSIDPNTITVLSSGSEETLKGNTRKTGETNGGPRAPPKASDSKSESNAFSPAPIPSSVYGQKQSLADILSSKSESEVSRSPINKGGKSASGTPKPQGKPVILKKKHSTVSSPAHQRELERLSSPDALELETKSAPEVSIEAELELDEGSKLEPIKFAKPDAEPLKDKPAKQEPPKSAPPARKPRDNLRRKLILRGKRASVDESADGTTVKPPSEQHQSTHRSQHNLTERNKSFSSQQHPDFKKLLIEMTLGVEERVRLDEKAEDKNRFPRRGGRRGGRRGASEFGGRGGRRPEGRRSSKSGIEGESAPRVKDKPPVSAESTSDGKQEVQESNGAKEGDDDSNEKNGRLNSRRGRGRGSGGRGGRGSRGRGRGRGGSERRNGGDVKENNEAARPPPTESHPVASA